MASLQLRAIEGPTAGQVVQLSGISVIGRDANSALVVSDPTVSREHAVVRPEGDYGYVVEDLDSRSGTFVNGTRTRKGVLRDGDLLQIGPSRFEVRAVADEVEEGDVPPEQVQLVTTREARTARLSTEVLRFRMKDDDLGELAESGEDTRTLEKRSLTDSETGRVEPWEEDEAGLSTEARRLRVLCGLAASLSDAEPPTRLSRRAARRLVRVWPQLRRVGVFYMEEDPEGGDPFLRPFYVYDRTAKSGDGPVQVSQTVLQECVEQRAGLVSGNVADDPRFQGNQSLDGVCSILSAPLLRGHRVLGALYVDTTDPLGLFGPDDLRLLQGIAALLAAALEASQLFARAQAESVRRANLERYFSPDLVERVLEGALPLAREGASARGTIVFVDIRGFTPLTDNTPPRLLVATLNAYFAAMQRIIFRSRGTVERFGGDSILAYWGVVDQDPEAPVRGAQAALQMLGEVFRLNPELSAAGRPPIRIGIGINTGDVVAGEVGSPERYEFTVLGSAINLAKRLESQAGAWEVIAGAETLRELGGRALHVPLDPTPLKGYTQSVQRSALFGLQTSAPGAAVHTYDLAVPGEADFGGTGPRSILGAGLTLSAHEGVLAILTLEDPEPGTAVWLRLRCAGASGPLVTTARVRASAEPETLMLASSASSLTGVQRIELTLDEPRALWAYFSAPRGG